MGWDNRAENSGSFLLEGDWTEPLTLYSYLPLSSATIFLAEKQPNSYNNPPKKIMATNTFQVAQVRLLPLWHSQKGQRRGVATSPFFMNYRN